MEGTPNKYETISSDCMCLIIIFKNSCKQHISEYNSAHKNTK